MENTKKGRNTNRFNPYDIEFKSLQYLQIPKTKLSKKDVRNNQINNTYHLLDLAMSMPNIDLKGVLHESFEEFDMDLRNRVEKYLKDRYPDTDTDELSIRIMLNSYEDNYEGIKKLFDYLPLDSLIILHEKSVYNYKDFMYLRDIRYHRAEKRNLMIAIGKIIKMGFWDWRDFEFDLDYVLSEIQHENLYIADKINKRIGITSKIEYRNAKKELYRSRRNYEKIEKQYDELQTTGYQLLKKCCALADEPLRIPKENSDYKTWLECIVKCSNDNFKFSDYIYYLDQEDEETSHTGSAAVLLYEENEFTNYIADTYNSYFYLRPFRTIEAFCKEGHYLQQYYPVAEAMVMIMTFNLKTLTYAKFENKELFHNSIRTLFNTNSI